MPHRVLIFGGNGMLGHKLWQVFHQRFETYATVRGPAIAYVRYRLFDESRLVDGVEVTNFDTVVRAMVRVRPSLVVNAVGIVKQINEAKDPILSLKINSLFPHQLADLCEACGTRLIQISTDCVFSGQKGNYTETDPPDATDLYGRTKLLGELDRPGCVTIRTSIIGRELERHTGLLDWFLLCLEPRVRGYTRAVFSGFTTLALAEILADVIAYHPNLSGLYHVSSKPITKYNLLCRVRDAFGKDIEIEPYAEFACDRSLDSTRFQKDANWQPPDWDTMIQGLAVDPTSYDNWRYS